MAKRRRRRKNSKGTNWLIFSIAFFLLLSFFAWRAFSDYQNEKLRQRLQREIQSDISQLELAEKNYGKLVTKIALEKKLPREYFMALIVLECSGREPAGNRFEPVVYRRLKNLKSGKRKRLEDLRQADVVNASDAALKNLATSWGPFQLMGYKCIGLGTNISDIRGKGAVKYGIEWVEENYGRSLREREFKDAFHLHNTGRKYPMFGKPFTHDPLYVERGLKYMDYFSTATITTDD
jgi:hypothetical protein